jgi:hypothetical protein
MRPVRDMPKATYVHSFGPAWRVMCGYMYMRARESAGASEREREREREGGRGGRESV